MDRAYTIFIRFLPFWLFLAVFKFGGGLHYTLMSPYGAQFFPIWAVGALIGGASLIQLILDVPAGYLLDRYGYLPMLRFTSLAFTVASLCIAFGLTELTYVLSLALSILGWQFYDPGASAYILSHTSDEASGRYFSLRDTFASVGIVLGSVALPFVLLFNPRLAGAILSVLFFAAFVILLFAPKDPVRVPPEREKHISRRRRSTWTLISSIRRLNPASGMLLLLTISAAIFYGVIWFVVPLVIAQEQSTAGLMGIGLGVFDFSVVVLGYIIGTLADRAEKRTMIFFGLLIFSIFGVVVGLNFGWLFILFGFIATAGEEMAGISLWSWLHSLDSEHAHDGAVSGVITLFQDLGWAIGPAIAGVLYTLVGPAGAIVIGAIPIFTVWLIYYIYVQERFPLESVYAWAPYRPWKRKHKS